MAFTYSDALSTNASKVRLNIGDTQENAGPRPDKRNFSDAEITYFLTEETNVNAASALAFEILASEWTSYALSETEDNTAFDAKETADKFAERAAFWRKKPGGAGEAERSGGLIFLERDDAYTDNSEYVT